MNRQLYSVLLHLALPVIALRLLWRSIKAPAYARRVAERFAFAGPKLAKGGIWVHAVSVGESIAAAPMIRELMARYPDLPMTVTCMTPTGSERIRALFGDQVQHCYLPYDYSWAAARFLKRLQPRLAVIVETELWPNHIHQCAKRGVPVALANGRLSERSARGYARFAKLTAPMLAELDLLAIQTQVEAQRFLALGARPEAVQVTGSIKFDLKIDPQLPEQAKALRQHWGAASRPVWIAASTHEGEDEIILAAHQQLLAMQPDALLILVPRHPERFTQVYNQAKAGFATVRRSLNEAVTEHTQVLLGDTMGELLFLYALADVALVGGSLIERGGHNLLEPAALGVPVLSGPYRFNFADISAQLEQAAALRTVVDASELSESLLQLFNEPAQREQMAAAGLRVMQANQGALARLLDGLSKLVS